MDVMRATRIKSAVKQRAIRNLYLNKQGAIAYTAGTNGNGGILADHESALELVREMGRPNHSGVAIEMIDSVDDMDDVVIQYIKDAGYAPEEYYPCVRLEVDDHDGDGFLTGSQTGILIGMW